MRVLIAGATGYLGAEVARLASAAGHDVTGTSSADLDITDRAAVRAFVAAVRPHAVINTAMRHGVWAVNADGAANLAVAATAQGARLVHLSSDALHAGRPEPYTEADPPTPIHFYGATKAAAETAVSALDPAAAIVRTSLIWGERSSHRKLILDLVAGAKGALFSDEIRCPVHVSDLAAAVLELAANDHAGIINVTGPQAVSRVELGRMVTSDPFPVMTIAEAGIGPRPADVKLDISLATRVLRTPLRAVRDFL